MENKIKLLAVASFVAVFASGCSGYNNGSDDSYSSTNGTSQNSGSGQVSKNSKTCAPCDAKKRTTYTYNQKPRVVYKPAVGKPAAKGSHNQQYYIDRWNSQQNKARTKTTNTVKRNTNNSGYGNGYYKPNTASSTTYYDYSSAGRKPATTGKVLTASNKSIYTGSYQKRTYKPYKPTTYAVGANSTTNYTAPSTTNRGGGGSSYVVKKGDTVFEIMRQTGVYWKDIIRLNNLTAPYNINPGQSIRLK